MAKLRYDVSEAILASELELMTAPVDPPVVRDEDVDGVIPAELRRWLVRLRLLEAVPFAYLVADTELLPEESIRWFYVDRRWTDALVQGVLSVGTVNSDDRTHLTAQYPAIRDELDTEERNLRRVPGQPRLEGDGGPISGFLLRSKAVSGWPALHVRAFSGEPPGRDDEKPPDTMEVRLLRLERLAPAVLLCLFDGIPATVHIEEPRQGVQFGFRVRNQANGRQQAEVKPRNADTFEFLPGDPEVVPFRADGAGGVVDIKRLERQLEDRAGSLGADGVMDSSEYALQLVQFPWRQVWGDMAHADTPSVPKALVFKPTITYAVMVDQIFSVVR
ncbi:MULTISPECIES: hypothetical protein [unclassified Nocardioides]|uniref:hypothetical protein n=1 Tax=unclassified Nocardioides TaxID=2615069 RepID=UPI003614B42E